MLNSFPQQSSFTKKVMKISNIKKKKILRRNIIWEGKIVLKITYLVMKNKGGKKLARNCIFK